VGFTIIAGTVQDMKQLALAEQKTIATTTETDKDIPHMEDKMIDYSDKLIHLNRRSKQLYELLLKRKQKESVIVVEDMIVELILLKNWLKSEDYK